ncbi:site-specific integrase [Haloactinopolyspora sp.]|uniref:tyrosine-type recombinase/integrase n=1 Tax=Haloactinopolyspora sp. TaxID=1966353 RepID=UPI002621170C|nr:site-specific integrase [Haloactinopolyspora sp.]
MGHVVKTPAGTWRANWRDPAGRQRAKTFPTKREASRFLAEVESTKSRGQYIDPQAGKTRFGDFAARWEAARVVEATTSAATRSALRARLLPYWGTWPLASIDHLAVQEWVNKIAAELAPSSVASLHGKLSAILGAAARARLIAANPCEGIRLPAARKADRDGRTITRDELVSKLLPVVPEFYRALPATAAGAGLRWGECLGLRWSDIDVDAGVLHVRRVVIEVRGRVTVKPYPKTRAGRRTVPMAGFLSDALRIHRKITGGGEQTAVFTGPDGGHLLRGNFRRRIWRPSLVRAGLLGNLAPTDDGQVIATWPTSDSEDAQAEFAAENAAIKHIVANAHGGLRFHDLRHCYATWLVSRNLPVNVVQTVMGHEQATTTLNLYTHASADHYEQIRRALDADDLLTDNQGDE